CGTLRIGRARPACRQRERLRLLVSPRCRRALGVCRGADHLLVMSNLFFDPLLISIATPLALALLIALGLPKRWSVRLSYVAFAVPLLLALHTWRYFAEQP